MGTVSGQSHRNAVMRELNTARVEYIVVTGATLIQSPWRTAELPIEVVEAASSNWVVQFTYAKRERKVVSTLLTRSATAASARLKRVVVSVGLGPSQLSRLAREPTGLQRGVVLPDTDTWRVTIVRRRFCNWRESSSRTQVARHTLQ